MNDGGHAFPIPGMTGLPNGEVVWPDFGMSLRDYFAKGAMQGVLAGWRDGDACLPDEVAEMAFNVADAMLRARERKRS